MWHLHGKWDIKHGNHPDIFVMDGKIFATGCQRNGYIALPVKLNQVYVLGSLTRGDDAPRHKDPFDRMILAQAKAENMMLLTHDSLLADYEEPFVITA